MSTHVVDILIVGSGPAGVSTALHLLSQDPGWAPRMLLLEKSAHPRPKLCGGGMTRLGLRVLDELGLPFPLPVPHELVEDVRFAYGGRIIHVRGRPQIAVFHRPELDAYLAQILARRGGQIRQDEPVREIEFAENGALVTTARDHQYLARVVVGADGAKGLTRRFIKRRRGPSNVARTLEQLAPAAEGGPLFSERCALFDFTPTAHSLQGYLWDFPSRKEGQPIYNRGIYDTGLAPLAERPKLPVLLADFLHGRGGRLEDNPFYGHPIHLYDPREPLSMPGLLLAGDAAGIDPLFGEGISPALASGKVAAQAIMAAFAQDDFSFRDYSRRVFASDLGFYLTLRWFLAWLVYSLSRWPLFMHAFWSLCWLAAAVWPEPPDLY